MFTLGAALTIGCAPAEPTSEAWVPCEPVHPWPLKTAGDALLGDMLGTPDAERLYDLVNQAWDAGEAAGARGESCPTVAREGAGTTLSGECTTADGVTFRGSMTQYGGSYDSTLVFDEFGFESLDDAGIPYGFYLDGKLRSGFVDPGYHYTEVHGTLTTLGPWTAAYVDVPVPVATVRYDWGYSSSYYEDAARAGGFAEVVAIEGSTLRGDLCVSSELRVPPCDRESGATTRLEGSNDAIVRWAGERTCDACAFVTLGNGPGALVCP